MVADLLDLSQLNAGVLPMRIELNAIDDLIGALVQRVEPSLGADRLRVSITGDEPLLLARFDLVHSLRILANLVENAAKYAPPSTPIEITAMRANGAIAIRVSDRGPGIPERELERVFEPFHRAHDATPDVSGAGLGLSIARRLADAQGGRLVYAPRPGGGSEFTLHLPAAEMTETGVPAA
jgi:two-component system sensor histidine kinase KdpD